MSLTLWVSFYKSQSVDCNCGVQCKKRHTAGIYAPARKKEVNTHEQNNTNNIRHHSRHRIDLGLPCRNARLPDGISIVSGDGEQLVDMGKSADYHIVIAAGEDMASGTYPLEIADKSSVDQHTWHTIDLHVTGGSVATQVATEPANEEEHEEDETKSPGFGFMAVVVAFGSLMALAYHSRFL